MAFGKWFSCASEVRSVEAEEAYRAARDADRRDQAPRAAASALRASGFFGIVGAKRAMLMGDVRMDTEEMRVHSCGTFMCILACSYAEVRAREGAAKAMALDTVAAAQAAATEAALARKKAPALAKTSSNATKCHDLDIRAAQDTCGVRIVCRW